jgi:hypothetical protein
LKERLTRYEETTMQHAWNSNVIAAASLPSHPAYREQRLQRQISTYLLYRSLSTDERNRRGLEWWREALRHDAEEPR